MTIDQKLIFLKNNSTIMNNYKVEGETLVINWSLRFEYNIELPEGLLDNCIINGNVHLDNLKTIPNNFIKNTIINGSLTINKLENISEGFLLNSIITELILNNVKSLPKTFSPNVRSNILLKNLKSVLVKKLIYYPGILRKLSLFINKYL